MDVTVSRRNTEVSDSLRLVAEEKIGRLGRYVDGLVHADVHFSELKNPRIAEREVCEVTLTGGGHQVRCKVRAPDGFVAVDRAYAKLERQLNKLKTRLARRYQGEPKARKGADALGTRAGPGPEDVEGDGLAEHVEEAPRIVKSKRFALFPMTAEEAAERMDLLGHGFFFFTNSETKRAAVVYKRDDGDVGLIDEAD